jgi:hypothetical protein
MPADHAANRMMTGWRALVLPIPGDYCLIGWQ